MVADQMDVNNNSLSVYRRSESEATCTIGNRSQIQQQQQPRDLNCNELTRQDVPDTVNLQHYSSGCASAHVGSNLQQSAPRKDLKQICARLRADRSAHGTAASLRASLQGTCGAKGNDEHCSEQYMAARRQSASLVERYLQEISSEMPMPSSENSAVVAPQGMPVLRPSMSEQQTGLDDVKPMYSRTLLPQSEPRSNEPPASIQMATNGGRNSYGNMHALRGEVWPLAQHEASISPATCGVYAEMGPCTPAPRERRQAEMASRSDSFPHAYGYSQSCSNWNENNCTRFSFCCPTVPPAWMLSSTRPTGPHTQLGQLHYPYSPAPCTTFTPGAFTPVHAANFPSRSFSPTPMTSGDEFWQLQQHARCRRSISDLSTMRTPEMARTAVDFTPLNATVIPRTCFLLSSDTQSSHPPNINELHSEHQLLSYGSEFPASVWVSGANDAITETASRPASPNPEMDVKPLVITIPQQLHLSPVSSTQTSINMAYSCNMANHYSDQTDGATIYTSANDSLPLYDEQSVTSDGSSSEVGLATSSKTPGPVAKRPRRSLAEPKVKVRETYEGCTTWKYLTKRGYVNVRRPYSCQYPDCMKAYTKSSHLRQHVRIHSGDRPYVCSQAGCKASFMRSDQLNRHMRKHTGEKPFACDWCPMAFTRSDHLAQHRKRHELRYARSLVK